MFNTLKYTKLLETVGMSRQQAEAQVQIMAEILEEDMATKSDLQSLRIELKSDMLLLEHRIVIKLGAIVVTTTSLAVAFSTWLMRIH